MIAMQTSAIVRLVSLILFAVLFLVILDSHASADTWPVTNRLLGKKGKKSVDISGIACTASQGFPVHVLSSMTISSRRSS